nr:uncharacterized protein LOC115261516 [Aedes albopictus]
MADNTVEVHLLISKSHLAPKATIPRLELCGFRLMSRLVVKVVSALKVKFDRKVLYSDSTITLGWLSKSPSQLNTYVANRVAHIQELTPRPTYDYKYVRTNANPADLVSRGLYPEALMGNRFWWHGPDFIQQSAYEEDPMEEIAELPEVKVAAAVATDDNELEYNRVLAKFSSFRKLQRVIAYVIRFANKTRKRFTEGDCGPYPTVAELRSSLLAIVYMAQQQRLQADIQEVQKKQGTTEKYVGRLRSLNPWIDSRGILRVNGRIKHANVSYEQRCPAVLPANHHVTDILIQAIHQENLHVGPNGTLSVLRQRYWVLNGRRVIRKQIRKCSYPGSSV